MNAPMPDHHTLAMPEGRDIKPFMERARDDIHEALMDSGCWPESPGAGRSWQVDLDIASYLNTLPGWESDEELAAMWRGGDSLDDVKDRHSARIKAWIPERLVMDRAEELAREAEEDEETEREYARLYPQVVELAGER